MSHTIGQAKEDNQKSASQIDNGDSVPPIEEEQTVREQPTPSSQSNSRLYKDKSFVAARDRSSNSNSFQAHQDSSTLESDSPELNSGLSDTNYEFLFNQLLEGVAHGWHDHRIIKFFKELGDRGRQADWISWLNRVRPKLLKLPTESRRQLGTIMIRLGELTQSTTQVNQIGATSHRLGRELISGDTQSVVWEYDGPDFDSGSVTTDHQTESELSARLPLNFEAFSSDTVIEPQPTATSVTEQSSEVASSTPVESLRDSPTKPPSELDSAAIELDLPTESNSTNGNSREINIDSAEFEFEPERDSSNSANLDQSISFDSEQTRLETEVALNNQTLELSDINDALDNEPLQTSSIAAQQPDPAAIDMEQVMHLLQEDDELAQQISAKLNLSLAQTPVIKATATSNTEAHHESLAPTKTSPELDDSSIELIESWFNLGLKHASAGEFDKAIASWEKALKINPNLAEAWHNRGSALGRLGRYEAAVKSFESALTIDSNNHQAWNDHAHALYQLQHWTEAVNSWSNAIKIMPGDHLFWYNRGCALEQLEQWQDAIASYEKALEIKPDFQLGRSRYINLVADNSCPN